MRSSTTMSGLKLVASRSASAPVPAVTAGQSSDVLSTIGRLLGLYAALLMAFQLLLVARLPWLDRRLGMDRLTSLHRWTGFSLVWLLVGHVVFVVYGYADLSGQGPVGEL